MRKAILGLLASVCAIVWLPSSPAAAEEPGVYVYGDWLSWKARRRDLDFVIVDPNNDARVEGSRESLNYDRDYGTRVGLGCRTNTGWELGAEYTYFRATDMATYNQPTGGSLWGTRLHPDSVIGDRFATSASAMATLDYDVFDLGVGHSFFLDERGSMSLKLFGGFRYAMIDQTFAVSYVDSVNSRTADIIHATKLDGYGVRLGSELEWHVYGGLKVFGRVAGSVLAAKGDSHYAELDNQTTALVNVTESYYQMVPVMETAVGLGYQRGPWELSAGYELAGWFNAGERLDFQDDVDEQKHSLSSSDLILDGFFVRIAFNR